MRDESIAKNYAETLFELAQRAEALDEYGDAINVVATLVDESPAFREFLETPRVASGEKKKVLEKTLGDRVPPMLLNFLKIVVDKRRQRLVRDIARSFRGLVDEHLGRAHVEVTVARSLSEDALGELSRKLSDIIGKTVIPHVQVKPGILGGVIVREGDTVYDGSMRRQLDRMRRRLLSAELDSADGASVASA